MEALVPFVLAAMGMHYIGISLLVAALVLTAINFKRIPPRNLMVLEIIILVLLLPGWFWFYKENQAFLALGILVLILTIIFSKVTISNLLGLLAFTLLFIKANFVSGLIAMQFSKQELVPSIYNKMGMVGFTSWFYYSIYIAAAGLTIIALYYFIKKRSQAGVNLFLILLTASVLIAIGAIRDNMVYAKQVNVSKASSKATQEVHKFLFRRNDTLFLTDTSGKTTPVQIASAPSGLTVNKAVISPDEKYLAYSIGKSQEPDTALYLINLASQESKKIYASNGVDVIESNDLAFSTDNLLIFYYIPNYRTPTKDSAFNYSGSYRKIVDLNGKEVNKVSGYEVALWNKNDLVLMKRKGYNQIEIYLSTGGKEQPKLIGQAQHDASQGGQRYFIKEPDGFVFQKENPDVKPIGNTARFQYLAYECYAFNLKTGQTTKINFPEPPARSSEFTSDFKYYTIGDLSSRTLFIKATDNSLKTDLSSVHSYYLNWVGYQLILSTDTGIKVSDIYGNISNITDNGQERVMF